MLKRGTIYARGSLTSFAPACMGAKQKKKSRRADRAMVERTLNAWAEGDGVSMEGEKGGK